MPTVATESVFITGAIEAHEGRVVACFDIPGAYLHADFSGKGEKFMLLEGQLAILMVLVEPNMYREYVTYSPSGVPMLYDKMQKTLYGMLESALAFYKLLRKKL